jgi:hypothetical protein
MAGKAGVHKSDPALDGDACCAGAFACCGLALAVSTLLFNFQHTLLAPTMPQSGR